MVRTRRKGVLNAMPFTKKKRLIAAASAVAAAAVAAVALTAGSRGDRGAALSQADMSVLTRSDLQNSISATGAVESAESVLVYSTQSYAVEEVCVEVGDYVEAGDLLARLDDDNIVEQIESQEAGISDANSASAASVAAARHNYEEFKSALDAGLNSSILSAENSVTSARNNYDSAVDTYERYKAELEAGTNTAVTGAEDKLDAAYDSYVSALNTYNRFKSDLDSGSNASILSAQTSLNNAYDAYVNALNAYERYRDALDDGENTQILQAKSSLRSAESGVDAAEDAYDQAEDALDSARSALAAAQAAGLETSDLEAAVAQAETAYTSAKRALDSAEDALDLAEAQYSAARTSADDALSDYESAADSAYTAYQTAQTSLQSAQQSAQNTLSDYAVSLQNAYDAWVSATRDLTKVQSDAQTTLSDYEDNVTTAQENYDSAQSALASAQQSAQSQLQTYRDSLNSAQAGASSSSSDVNLQHLRADLAGTEITAPLSGTVTAVYAEVGASGAGLLFVIEDVDDLVVSTSVKDYDVGSVAPGMAVTIRSDSTGDAVYDGEISSIAPTADKNALGETDTSGDVTFAADVKVTSKDTALKIGMSVRLNFILDEAKNVLTVPYDAVYENGDGQTCLLLAEEQEDGRVLLREVPVTKGLENDLDVEISGADLDEGLTYVSSPAGYVSMAGQEVRLSSEVTG